MSWLFSQALVAEYSAATCSAGAQSALSSGSHMPQAFLPSDKMMGFSRPSRFGMTFKPLTENLGAELLTWFLAASRARTSALPEKARASAANDPGCGPTWRASLAKFDPVSRLWKTAQLCLLGDSELSSVTWPRSGMTANGQCWELPKLGRSTSATDSGLWPTPTCPNGERSVAHVTDWRSERTAYTSSGKKVQVDLAQAVKRWPTPTVVSSSGGAALCKWGGSGSREMLKKIVTPEELNGALNPTWVEWLMGWPLGWTDLEPLATDKYLNAQPRRGAC